MEAAKFFEELSGGSPISSLQKYINLLEKEDGSTELLKEFLSLSSNCNEVLHLLQRESLTPMELATIFTFLSHVLQSATEENSSCKAVGLHIVKQVMESYKDSLHRLIAKGTSATCVVAGLRCLTEMIMLGSIAASQVLAQLDWTSINFALLANRRDSCIIKDIRGCLIHFFFAFLHIDDPGCLEHFLKLPDVLSSIFQGIMKDSSERAVKILSMLHDVIIANKKISKTIKVRIFSIPNCRTLLSLYEWRGPDKISKEEMKGYFSLTSQLTPKQAIVRMAIHKLMLSLFTSSKNGIIFKTDNSHALKVLSIYKSLWNINEGRELVSLTLNACPEITDPFMMAIKPALKPSSKEYLSAIDLVISIINALETNLTLSSLKDKKPILFSQKSLFTSPNMLADCLKTENLETCHAGLKLCFSILKKSKEIISAIEDSQNLDNKLKDNLTKQLTKGAERFCQIDYCIETWAFCVNRMNLDESDKYSDVGFKTLKIILKIMITYAELFSFSALEEKANAIKMSIDFFSLCEKKNVLDKSLSSDFILDALNFILLGLKKGSLELFSSSLNSLFGINGHDGNIFRLFIWMYINIDNNSEEKTDKSSEAIKNLIVKLLDEAFSKIQISPEGIPCAEIWLNFIPKDSNDSVLSYFFNDVVKNAVRKSLEYSDTIHSLSPETGFMNLEDALSMLSSINLDQVEISDNTDIFIPKSLPFSCLIVGAVDVLRESSNEQFVAYFSRVIDEYLHYINEPELLSRYLLSCEVKLSMETTLYLQSWSEPVMMDISLSNQDDLLHKLKKIFMSKDHPNFDKFTQEMFIKTDEVFSAIRQIVHYLRQDRPINNLMFQSKLSKFYINVLKELFKHIVAEEHNKVFSLTLEYFLRTPFILKSYNPFNEPQDFNEIIERAVCMAHSSYPELIDYTRPYFEKALKNLSLSVTTNFDFWKPFETYFSCHSLWNFELLETTLVLCLDNIHWGNESIVNMTKKLLVLLVQYSSSKYSPSEQTIRLIFSKANFLSNNLETFQDVSQFVDHLQRILCSLVDEKIALNLSEEEVLHLVNAQSFNSALCCKLINVAPSFVPMIVKQLKSIPLSFPMHVSLIDCLLKSKRQAFLNPYLIKAKKHLLDWALSEDSKEDLDCQEIFRYMLQEKLIQSSEALDICNVWYNRCVSPKIQPPHHLLSLLPFFDYFTDSYIKLEDKPLPFLYLYVMMTTLKKYYGRSVIAEPYSNEYFAKVAGKLLQLTELTDANLFLNEIRNSKIWAGFAKQILKHSLSDLENGPALLSCLVSFVKKVYAAEDSSKDEGSLPIGTLFQMLRSHSKFIQIMLNPENSLKLKEHLLLLHLSLIERKPKLCEERHVPILLGAYGASRTTCDEAIFMLLRLYEDEGCMSSYYPTLWGKAASIHFAVQEDAGGFSLRRSPAPNQILALLDKEKVINTSKNFQIDLTLEAALTFVNDDALYDQRYLLLTFLHISDISMKRINGLELTESGAMALAIAALSSSCPQVWSVGAAILRNIVKHLERVNGWSSKMPWIWLIAILGYGLEGTKKRVPSLVVHFLIEASQMLSSPSSSTSYLAAMNYLYLQPGINFNKVPEFSKLFNTDSVEHRKEHRTFLLSILHTGIRDTMDFRMCLKKGVPQLILSLVSSPTATSQIRVLCIEVLEAMLSIPEGRTHILDELRLLSIIPSALNPNNSFCKSDRIPFWADALVKLLCKVWSLKKEDYLPKIVFLKWKLQRLDKRAYRIMEKDNLSSQKLEDSISDKRKSSSNRSPTKKIKASLPDMGGSLNDDPGEDMKSEGESSGEDHSVSVHKTTSKKRIFSSLSKEDNTKIKMLTDAGIKFIMEFGICLSYVVPTIVEHGWTESLASCLALLNDIIAYYDRMKRESPVRILNYCSFSSLQLRKKVKSWIDAYLLLQRLHALATDDDEYLLTKSSSVEMDWKTSYPLPTLPIRKKCDNLAVQDDPKESDVRLLESTRKLFHCLSDTES